MRTLLTILSIFFFAAANAQSPLYVKRYFTTTDQYGASFNCLIYMPVDSVSSGKKKPAIFFGPGAGQTGASSSEANANVIGPTRQVSLGTINGRVRQGNDSVLPIRIVIQRATSTNRDTLNYACIKKVIDLYINYIDTFQMHLCGYSLGGINIGRFLVNNNNRASQMYRFASMFMVAPGGTDGETFNNLANSANYALAGGHMLMLTGTSDGTAYHVTSSWLNPMNNAVAGSATGRDWNSTDNPAGTGHGPAGIAEMFYQSMRLDVMGSWAGGGGYRNAEEWMLQFSMAPVQSADAIKVPGGIINRRKIKSN